MSDKAPPGRPPIGPDLIATWIWAGASMALAIYGDRSDNATIRVVGIASFVAAFALFAYLVAFKYLPDLLGQKWWRKENLGRGPRLGLDIGAVWLWAVGSVALRMYGESSGSPWLGTIGAISFLAAFAIFACLIIFKYMPAWLGSGWWRKRR